MKSRHAPLLIVISGPTAVGKTSLSIRIAKELGAEIISADSRQVYKEMNIGTAKPSESELREVPHHFIDHISIQNEYSAGDYESEVIEFLSEYFKHKPIAVMVGGTGFYIQAVLKGLDRFPRISKQVKASVQTDLESQGLAFLRAELKSKDPKAYDKLDINNPRRVSRALEVIRQSGKKFSSFKTHSSETRPFQYIKIVLERDREELYDRINRRVDSMIDEGLEEEARQLYPYKHLSALQTVGYQEWFDHFDGKSDRKTAVEKIKQHTRNYAKRQLTWFRGRDDWDRFKAEDQEKILEYILEHPKFKSAQVHSQEDDQ